MRPLVTSTPTTLRVPSELVELPNYVLAPAAVELKEQLELEKSKLRSSGEVVARYKIELMLSEKRSLNGLSVGVVTWWHSGTKFHGGGDAKMYLCSSNVEVPSHQDGCGKFIPDTAQGLAFVPCPHCGVMWQSEQLTGEIVYNLPTQKWADVLLGWFIRLNMDADIKLKWGALSIRTAQQREEEKKLRGELLGRVREVRRSQDTIYELKQILKDTSAGADLRKCLLAFLRA